MKSDAINLTGWQTNVGFSQASVSPLQGRLVLVSGAGSEAATGAVEGPGDVRTQCELAWENIAQVLAEARGSVADIVRVRSFVTDVRSLPVVTQTRKAALGDPPYPPHTFLVVAGLAQPGMLVEIEVDALIRTA